MAGAVIEAPEGLLLVRNRRRDGSHDWTPPGGVVDPGESVVEGLGREVEEETGLVVQRWSDPLYRITAEAPGLGWLLRVEVRRAERWTGELRVGHDPDGIVVEAGFVPPSDCAARLAGAHPWVAEPVAAWLASPWEGSRHFGYRVEGDDLRSLVVTRS